MFETETKNTTMITLFVNELSRYHKGIKTTIMEQNINKEPVAQSISIDDQDFLELISTNSHNHQYPVVNIKPMNLTYNRFLIDIFARMINPTMEDRWFDKMPKTTSIYDLPFDEFAHQHCVDKIMKL